MSKPKYNSDTRNFDLVCYFDGACIPTNPGGHMGAGIIIQCNQKKTILHENSFYYEPFHSNTNNVAEAIALYNLLDYLIRMEWTNKRIVIYGDSDLVIKHMSKDWEFKDKGGRYHDGMKKLFAMDKLFTGRTDYRWLPRHMNQRADLLSQYKLKQFGVVRSF